MAEDQAQPPSPDRPADSNPASKSPTPPPAKKKHRGRRWAIVLASVLVVLLLLVVLAPSFLSTGLGRSLGLKIVNGNLDGRLEVADWSLGWNSGVTLDGIKLFDQQGSLILQASRVRTQLSLSKALRSGFTDLALGRTDVDNLDLTNIHIDPEGTPNVAKVAKASKKKQKPPSAESTKISGDIHINNMTGNVTAAGVAQKLHINPSNIALNIKGLNDPIENDIQLAFNVEDPARPSTPGSIHLNGVADLFDNGKLRLDTATIKEQLKIADVDLAAVNPFLAIAKLKLNLGGLTNGAVDVNAQGASNAGATGQIKVKDFVATGEALDGDEFRSNLDIPIKVTRSVVGKDVLLKIEDTRIATDYGSIAITADASQESLDRLARREPPGREGHLALTADFDQAAKLLNSMPHTLKLVEGVRIDSARLFAQADAWLYPDRVVSKTQFNLADVSGTNKSSKIALAPVTSTIDATYVPTPGQSFAITQLRDVGLALDSAFAKLSGETGKGGTLAQFTLNGNGDLDKLQRQLKQFMKLEPLELKGTWTLKATTDGDPTKPDAAIKTNVGMTVKDLVVKRWADHPPISEPRLDLTANGDVHLEKNSPRSISGAVLTLKTNDPKRPTVDLLAKGDFDFQTFAAKSFDLSVKAILGQAREELAGVVPALADFESGELSVTAAGAYDGTTLTLAKPLALNLTDVSMTESVPAAPAGALVPPAAASRDRTAAAPAGEDVDAEKPLAPIRNLSTQLTLAGVFTRDAKGMNLKDATLDVSDLKFRRGEGSYDSQGKPISLKLAAAIATIAGGGIDKIELRTLAGDLLGGQLKMTRPIAIKNISTARAIDGALDIQGQLERPLRLLEAFEGAKPGTKYPYSGEYALVQDFASQGTTTKLAGLIKVPNFRVLDPKNPSRATFSENLLTVTNDVSIDTKTDTATIRDLSLNMQSTGALALALSNGQLIDWANQRKIADKLQARLRVDWPKFWMLVRPMLDPKTLESLKDLELAGVMDKTFTVTGSFPATGANRRGQIVPLPFQNSIKFIKADGGLSIDRVYVSGLEVRNLDVPVVLSKGVAVIKGSKPISCNGGTIDLEEDQIDLTTVDPKDPGAIVPTLTIPARNKKVFSNVSLNPILAQTFLGSYVNTAFSGSEKASGGVELVSVYCDRLPLGQYLKEPKNPGRAQFILSMSEVEIKGQGIGYITTAIGTALSALGGGMDRFDNLHGSIKEAVITIEGGRVTHKLPLQTDRLGTWVFDGELGIADQRFSYLNLDLPTSIFNSRDLARYVGDHITFPFSGPINRPTLAKDFVAKFAKENLLKGGLPNLLEGALKGKDKGKGGGGGSPRSSADDANAPLENPKPRQDSVGELLDIAGGLLNKDKNKDKKKEDRDMRENPESRDIGNQRISSEPKPAAATAPSTAPTTQRNVSGRTRGLREENKP